MIELLTTAEMAEADRLTIAGGIPGIKLMENAGRAVADAVSRHSERALPAICVIAGPGNNGGDGYVAARVLAGSGFVVRVLTVGDHAKLRGDAAEAAGAWRGDATPVSSQAIQSAGLIIDAIFGAGLDRPVTGEGRMAIEAINAAGAPVIAVDLPSGINGSTGAVMGAAVRATETVTFFRRKPGHLLLPGRLHCGSLTVADIGIPQTVLQQVQPHIFANVPALWAETFPIPQADGHKYSRGHAVVVTGGLARTGAGRLAARGALRAGAGLVTIASPPEALAVNATANLAVMVREIDNEDALAQMLADHRFNAIVLGPGGGVGPALQRMALTALNGPRAAVLDADALTSFEHESPTLFAATKARQSAATVLTPHQGEFERLFKSNIQAYDKSSKCDRASDAAAVSGAVILLKGADTVVASPLGRISIADNAPPWLATAGSGDVLAGLVAGLLAQGMPPFEAASAAVWLHGEAANEVGPGLIAEDLPESLRAVYRRLFVDLGAWP